MTIFEPVEIPTIDLLPERLDVGDRAQFPTKMNNYMTKLESWTAAMYAAMNELNSFGLLLQELQVSDSESIASIQGELDERFGNALGKLSTLREIGDEIMLIKNRQDNYLETHYEVSATVSSKLDSDEPGLIKTSQIAAAITALQQSCSALSGDLGAAQAKLASELDSGVTGLVSTSDIAAALKSTMDTVAGLGINDVRYLSDRLQHLAEEIEAETAGRSTAIGDLSDTLSLLVTRLEVVEGDFDISQIAADVASITSVINSLPASPEIAVITGLRAELDGLAASVQSVALSSYALKWAYVIAEGITLQPGDVVLSDSGIRFFLVQNAVGTDLGQYADMAALNAETNEEHGDTAGLISDGKLYYADTRTGATVWTEWDGLADIPANQSLDPDSEVTSWQSVVDDVADATSSRAASGKAVDAAIKGSLLQDPRGSSTDNGLAQYGAKTLADEMDRAHKYVVAENPASIDLQCSGQGPNYRITLDSGSIADAVINLPEQFADGRALYDGATTAEIRFIPGAGVSEHRLSIASVSHDIEGDESPYRILSDEENAYRFVFSAATGWTVQRWSALPFSPFIDPRRYGLARIDDSNASVGTNSLQQMQDMIDDLPVGREATFFVDGSYIIRDGRIVFPREGSAGRNINLMGNGPGESSLVARGSSDSGYAWADFSVGSARPGHTAGTAHHGGCIDRIGFVGNNTGSATPADVLIHIGLCAHLSASNMRVQGGAIGMQLWQVADPNFMNLTLTGHWTNDNADNILLDVDYGSNSVHIIGGFMQKFGKRAIRHGSNRCDEDNAVTTGPGKCRYIGVRFDQAGHQISEHVLLESGPDTLFSGCRFSTGGASGDPSSDQPFIRQIAPTGNPGLDSGLYVDAPRDTKVRDTIMRATHRDSSPETSTSDTTYVTHNDAGGAITLADVTLENIKPASGDMYRGIGEFTLARDVVYENCNDLTETDRVYHYEAVPASAARILRSGGWAGSVNVRRSSTAMELRIARAGSFSRLVDNQVSSSSVDLADPLPFKYIDKDGDADASDRTTIDPDLFESGNSLVSVNSGSATVQRLYYDPIGEQFYMMRGQRQYSDIDAAHLQADSYDKHNQSSQINEYVLLARIVVSSGVTSLDSANDCRLIQTPKGQ